MTCSEFAVKFNLMLDGVLPEPEKVDVLEHRQSCASCQEYASGIEMVISAVKQRPLLEMPEDLVQKLIAIEEALTVPRVSWKPYILRGLAIMVAASLTLALPNVLPALGEVLPRTLVLTSGVVMVSIRRLLPGFIPARVRLQKAIEYRKEVFAQ